MKLSETHSTGIAILSNRAPQTLAHSLASYEKIKLKEMFTEECLVFQAVTPKDLGVADLYSYRCHVAGYNSGVLVGLHHVLDSMESEYILLMENDCPILPSLNEVEIRSQLQESLNILISREADMVRLRHSWQPGGHVNAAKRYSRYYDIEELAAQWKNAESLDSSPSWLKTLRRLCFPQEARNCIGRSVYVEQSPHLCFPRYISKKGDHYIVDSEVFDWTNQPTLLSRRFLASTLKELEDTLDLFLPHGNITEHYFQERMNSHQWRKKHHKIAIAPGIFTHQEE